MGYPPSQRGYRVHSIATHHFFTSGNIIFDENIPYNSLHSLPAAINDYSTLPFLEQCPSDIEEAPELPPNPSNLDMDLDNLDHLDTLPHSSPSPPPGAPTMPPPVPQLVVPLSAPHPVWTRSRENLQMRKLMEKGRLFEEKIEAEKDHLAKVREVVTRQGGVSKEGSDESEDENPFIGGRFEKAMVATLDADDYLQ